MTEIYLLRHGETPWNADRNRYCGRTDIPLSRIGRAQAAALREALVSVPLAAMYVSPLARSRPDIASGALAEWDGKEWNVVRRNQFTEVTGPGGIYGNAKPESDPIWSIGWDHRSLILMVLDGGKWHTYRLPKGSHSYDGAHGWNTEWPRIRDIGETDLLMTMHGAFWRFPRKFGAANSAGMQSSQPSSPT